MAENSLAGGFAAPAVNSAVAFRGIMMAMAEPGRIMPVSGGIPPRPMDSAAGVLALTLCAGSYTHLTLPTTGSV